MVVQGRLEAQNVISNQVQKEKADSFQNLIFTALASSGVEISANFKFQTKMDNFELGAISFAGNVGYKAPGETSPNAGSQQMDFKTIGKQFEDFGNFVSRAHTQLTLEVLD